MNRKLANAQKQGNNCTKEGQPAYNKKERKGEILGGLTKNYDLVSIHWKVISGYNGG